MKHLQTTLLAALLTTTLSAQPPAYIPTSGLIAWFPFNGNALDESGNGHDLTVNGATLTNNRNGQANSAYHFNGNSAHMNGGSHTDLEITGDRTVSVWVNAGSTLTDDQGIVGYIGSSGALAGHAGYYLKRRLVDPNEIGAYEDSALWGTGSYVAAWSDAPMSVGQWHHLVHWRSGGVTHLWVDGTLQNVSYQLTPYFMNSELLVGWSGSAGQYFHGDIDDIAFWDRALTPAEIGQVFSAGSGSCLIASYDFNGDAIDATNNGHDGTVFGATPAVDRFGNADGCYQFDGINDYIDVTGDWSDGGTQGTLMAWIYIDDLVDYRPIFTHVDDPNNGNALGMSIDCESCQDTGELWYVFDDRDCGGHLHFESTDDPMVAGVWTHVAMVADDASIQIYVNCQMVATHTLDFFSPGLWFGEMCSGNFITHIGRGGNEFFKGRIDDVRIYNCALDAAEIASLCDATTYVEASARTTKPTLYPNPTDGIVQIAAMPMGTEVQVFDATGRMLFAERVSIAGSLSIDLSSLASGSYAIRAGIHSWKVIRN